MVKQTTKGNKMKNKKTKTFISLPVKENIIDIPIIQKTDQDYINLKRQCENQDSIFKDISLEHFKKIVQNYIKINFETIKNN